MVFTVLFVRTMSRAAQYDVLALLRWTASPGAHSGAAPYFFRAYLNTAAVGLPELVHASSW